MKPVRSTIALIIFGLGLAAFYWLVYVCYISDTNHSSYIYNFSNTCKIIFLFFGFTIVFPGIIAYLFAFYTTGQEPQSIRMLNTFRWEQSKAKILPRYYIQERYYLEKYFLYFRYSKERIWNNIEIFDDKDEAINCYNKTIECYNNMKISEPNLPQDEIMFEYDLINNYVNK
jgi:hypothetical protein